MSYDALVGSSLLGVHTTQLGVQTTQHFRGLPGHPDQVGYGVLLPAMLLAVFAVDVNCQSWLNSDDLHVKSFQTS